MPTIFEQKRKSQEIVDEDEFLELVESYRTKINKLDDSEDKRGLLKALPEV